MIDSGKITAGIIDDEGDGRAYVQLLLKNEFPEIEIVFEGESIKDSINLLYKHEVDILFLDVQLTDGSVFTLLEKLDPVRLKNTQLVFITAYEQYSLPAIKAQAVDYLLKPCAVVDFCIAVNRCLDRLESNKSNNLIIEGASQERDGFLIVPTLNGFLRIPQREIVYCEADSNYTKIILESGQTLLASKNLKEYERILTSKNFFRIHHKYLINTDYISEYIRGKGGQIILNKKYYLDVSVRKKADLMEYLQILG